MTRRILILDVALLSLLVIGVIRFEQDWSAFEPTHQVSAIQPKPETFPALPAAGTTSAPPLEDWTEIASRNPFSFDRSDVAILAPAEPPKPSGPKPVLFGTMSLGAEPLALLAPGQPGNRNTRPLKVGETIDGWTVVKIDTKTVVVEANGNRETVIMNDPTAQIPRDSTKTTASAPVPSVVQASSPPSTPVTAPAGNGAPVTSTAAPPQNGQRRTRIMLTPFGPKVVEEEPQ